jgi:hypothetical protein
MAQNDQEPKIEYIKSNLNKEELFIDDKYIFNFSRIKKNKSKLYRCSYYKKSSKCSAYIKNKLDNTIEDYHPKHNHNIEEIAGARAKSEIKNKINLIHNPFNITPYSLYKDSIKDKGFLQPEYFRNGTFSKFGFSQMVIFGNGILRNGFSEMKLSKMRFSHFTN